MFSPYLINCAIIPAIWPRSFGKVASKSSYLVKLNFVQRINSWCENHLFL